MSKNTKIFVLVLVTAFCVVVAWTGRMMYLQHLEVEEKLEPLKQEFVTAVKRMPPPHGKPDLVWGMRPEEQEAIRIVRKRDEVLKKEGFIKTAGWYAEKKKDGTGYQPDFRSIYIKWKKAVKGGETISKVF